jgi:hypothetical protein
VSTMMWRLNSLARSLGRSDNQIIRRGSARLGRVCGHTSERSPSSIRVLVVITWRRLRLSEPRGMRWRHMRASDDVMRCRCKVILALVQGSAPTTSPGSKAIRRICTC